MHDSITMTSQTVPDIDDVFGTWPADSQSDKGKRLTKLGMLHGGEGGGRGTSMFRQLEQGRCGSSVGRKAVASQWTIYMLPRSITITTVGTCPHPTTSSPGSESVQPTKIE